MEPGNPNYEMTYACTGILDYLTGIVGSQEGDSARDKLEKAFDFIAEHEALLSERLLRYLDRKHNVTIVGRKGSDVENRVATISFIVDGRQSDDIVRAVDDCRIGIRFGDFYARRLAEDLDIMDINGVVRVSMVHYNTIEEVDSLVDVLEKII